MDLETLDLRSLRRGQGFGRDADFQVAGRVCLAGQPISPVQFFSRKRLLLDPHAKVLAENALTETILALGGVPASQSPG